ncbi:MAG: ribonuclease HII [Ktedonobacterales bacterium]|nr:ribonuclease HII [Ktedonobacterales bacterium]
MHDQGFAAVAGLDEVGRGCLAGPVVAAAVILPLDDAIMTDLDGVRDSKELSATRREQLAVTIRRRATAWAVGICDAATIDARNILQATRLAMHSALAQLSTPADALLLDAIRLPEIPLPQVPLIKGDQRSLSIAAASILAKVTRDALMEQLDATHPGYGFARHKGYGTPQHLAALQALGPCPAHRRSFAPVRSLTNAPVQLSLLSDGE